MLVTAVVAAVQPDGPLQTQTERLVDVAAATTGGASAGDDDDVAAATASATATNDEIVCCQRSIANDAGGSIAATDVAGTKRAVRPMRTRKMTAATFATQWSGGSTTLAEGSPVCCSD